MFGKLFKSKTVKFNALAPAIVGLLMACGVEVPAEAVTGVMAIGNFILRMCTTGAIRDK